LSNKPGLFIDDERFPPDDKRHWVTVRTSAAAIAWIKKHGIPHFISFDHDLGGTDTAMEVVKFIAKNTIELKNMTARERWFTLTTEGRISGLKFPVGFMYYVHSQNPIGKRNIEGMMNSILKEMLYGR